MKIKLNKITLVLADDEPVARAGIRSLLSKARDIEIVGEAQDGYEAQRLVAEMRPRILLLDLKMPGPRPAELERWILEHYPETATLVLTAHHRTIYLADMMEAGVAGYLKKNVSPDALIEAIRKAASGSISFSDEQNVEIAQWKKGAGKKLKSLSKREREVLQWISSGAQNRFIASELSITIDTVESHVRNILDKLAEDSRQKAAVWFIENSHN